MTTLNTQFVLSIFQAVAQGTAQGSYAIVPADAPEVAALVKAKYIKVSKKLHNVDGNVGATLCDGANEADLRIDFEIADFQAPVEAAVEEVAPAAPFALEHPETAPVAQTEAPAAPVLEETVAAPFGTTNPEAAEAPTHTAPEFTAMTAQIQTPATSVIEDQPTANPAELGAAPVVEQEGVKIIGDDAFDVASVAQTRNGEVDIDVGVPFVVKVSKAERKKATTGLEHHPFKDIAAFKLQNPSSAPSFHVAGRAVKDMSNSVRRANERFEKEGSTVTFRAQPAAEHDPKGTGVRVFALFVHEAPAQRRSTRKVEADVAEQTEE